MLFYVPVIEYFMVIPIFLKLFFFVLKCNASNVLSLLFVYFVFMHFFMFYSLPVFCMLALVADLLYPFSAL